MIEIKQTGKRESERDILGMLNKWDLLVGRIYLQELTIKMGLVYSTVASSRHSCFKASCLLSKAHPSQRTQHFPQDGPTPLCPPSDIPERYLLTLLSRNAFLSSCLNSPCCEASHLALFGCEKYSVMSPLNRFSVILPKWLFVSRISSYLHHKRVTRAPGFSITFEIS